MHLVFGCFGVMVVGLFLGCACVWGYLFVLFFWVVLVVVPLGLFVGVQVMVLVSLGCVVTVVPGVLVRVCPFGVGLPCWSVSW